MRRTTCGRYRREELFEAARRSRACAYLADDDHGPLALQEIILAGCPTVGVRTGASLVRHGVTGLLVGRLPPGRKCVTNGTEESALQAYLDAIRETQGMDRPAIREAAAREFRMDNVTHAVLAALDLARSI